MEQILNILSNLDVRLVRDLQPTSNDGAQNAVYQFVAQDTNQLLVGVDVTCLLHFEAFYRHKGSYYPHPYTLRETTSRSLHEASSLEDYQHITYDISLSLKLKRLRDFESEDVKRYYEAIDSSIDATEELYDFHDVYLILHCTINGQSAQYQCNNSRSIHLPRFISNPWTLSNTLIRFRYNAENRDGVIPCEMTLRCGIGIGLQSYKIILCLISNTIPARMDYHAIRWLCRLKPDVSRKTASSTQRLGQERLYCLNHESGIVVAYVHGSDLRFTPRLSHPINNMNYVKSYFEPGGFQDDLENSDVKDSGALAVIVIKGTDYPEHMRKRRIDPTILRYLPFNELEDVHINSRMSNEQMIRHLKKHKERCNQQLILDNNNQIGTYSQAHVRLYVAAYDVNDILLTETVHPPLRNNKIFESLRILKIVQSGTDLRAGETVYIYCEYDYSKPRSEQDTCPYQFQLVFTLLSSTIGRDQLLQLFNTPHICTTASYVPNCSHLLSFRVPDAPLYDRHRVFIRLRHSQSRDYNPSPIALNDTELWTYYASPLSVVDTNLGINFDEIDDLLEPSPSITYENIELRIQPVCSPSFLQYSPFDSHDSSQDSDHSNGRLNTPEIESATSRRISFPLSTSQDNDDQ